MHLQTSFTSESPTTDATLESPTTYVTPEQPLSSAHHLTPSQARSTSKSLIARVTPKRSIFSLYTSMKEHTRGAVSAHAPLAPVEETHRASPRWSRRPERKYDR